MKHLIMGTAGHIDHGKTSLIKALTGIDCDTHKEEKRRGITINLGFSYLDLPNGESIGIIDVPGHKDFINTMVGGACGIDFVLLVIAADSGIMPQTVEHIHIINALGVSKGIVALTKADLSDEELLEVATYEIDDFLKTTTLQGAPIVPVSSVTGSGLEALKSAIEQLLPEIPERKPEDCFRMYIDRIFSVKGFGSVVTGSVMGGGIRLEQEVYLLPGQHEKLRIRSIERHAKSVDNVIAGDRAAINLIGLDVQDFKRGMLISDKKLHETSMVDAHMELFGQNEGLALWSQVSFHSGTFECPARIHNLNTDLKESETIVQIHLTKPAVLLNADRFIIRNSSGTKTLGGGFIIDSAPLHHKKRTPKLAGTLKSLARTMLKGGGIAELVSAELKKDPRPFTADEVGEKLRMSHAELKEQIRGEESGFVLYESPETSLLIHTDFDEFFSEKLLQALRAHHTEFPLFPSGLSINELAGKLGLSKDKNGKLYLLLLLDKLVKKDQTEKYETTWIIKGHKPVIDPRTQEEINWMEAQIREYTTTMPVMSEIEELAAQRKIPKNKLKSYITYLSAQRRIVTYQNEILHAEHIATYRQALLEMCIAEPNGVAVNDYKARISGTKRLCAFLVGVYETEKLIHTTGTGPEQKIFITPAGRKLL
jgi:selenocysteine-specific elongation factor